MKAKLSVTIVRTLMSVVLMTTIFLLLNSVGYLSRAGLGAWAVFIYPISILMLIQVVLFVDAEGRDQGFWK